MNYSYPYRMQFGSIDVMSSY